MMDKKLHPMLCADMQKAFEQFNFPAREAIAPLSSVEARYTDLLNMLGVTGHDGAISEINRLRKYAGLDK